MEFISLIEKRTRIARSESDSVYFSELLLYGEFITKLIAVQLVSAIRADKERTQYSYEHRLVRGNSTGHFAEAIDEIIINHRDRIDREFLVNEVKELTVKAKEGDWQYDAVASLYSLAKNLNITLNTLSTKISLRRWFSDFTVLRNKSKGHGALKPSVQAENALLLEKAIRLIVDNYFGLVKREWAHLYQNLSGKYKVSSISKNNESFSFLKSSDEYNFQNGVYFFADKPICVKLLYSTSDLEDFFLPNGNFKKGEFEILSYITGTLEKIKNDTYLIPITELPKSHTEGKGKLDVQGESFGNLPPKPDIYISRKKVEKELNLQLRNQFMSPIITLLGKGGIGKTTTALNCLHLLSEEEQFQLVLWFSSRDIDLLQQGPKVVKAKVFSIQDIADEYSRLLELEEKGSKERIEALQNALSTESELGKTLFVFDNFETIDDPLEVYNWLYQYIRPPNKILITSRESRDFKGDYPIEIGRMGHEECSKLIDAYSTEMHINQLISPEYRNRLINESNGHPYIIKILLGERLKDKGNSSIERIVAGRDDILTALFRRTYSSLSPAAVRVFLTLCSWRSTIPEIAVEAVLLRPDNEERIDVLEAIEELRKCSLIDITKSNTDNSRFIGVPLAASIFGKSELDIYPDKLAILEDRKLLLQFGVTQEIEVKEGLLPKIERKFRAISKEVSRLEDISNSRQEFLGLANNYINQALPVLEYLCSRVPTGYIFLTDLYSELGIEEKVITYTLRFIQHTTNDSEKRNAWRRLVNIYMRQDNWVAESHALMEICLIPYTSVTEISNIADRILRKMLEQNQGQIDFEHKNLLFDKVSEIFEKRIHESNDSRDYSRLAWISLHLKNKEKAYLYATQGLEKNSNCSYCSKLISKLA